MVRVAVAHLLAGPTWAVAAHPGWMRLQTHCEQTRHVMRVEDAVHRAQDLGFAFEVMGVDLGRQLGQGRFGRDQADGAQEEQGGHGDQQRDESHDTGDDLSQGFELGVGEVYEGLP